MSILGRLGDKLRRVVFVALALGALVMMAAACEADVAIDLDVAENGSGSIRVDLELDSAAASTLGAQDGEPFTGLFVDDLVAAGWDIDGPDAIDDGGQRLRATKQVVSSDQWQPVLDELAGVGVFDDVRVTRTDEFARHRHQLRFDLDLSRGWSLLSDDEVADALGGQAFGRPLQELTNGDDIDDIMSISLAATVANDESTTTSDTFEPRFDDDEPLRVNLVASSENQTAVLLRWIAIALGALAALAFVLAIVGIVLQRRTERLRPAVLPDSLRSRVPGHTDGSGLASRSDDDSNQGVRLVIVEPRTVLYDEAVPIEGHVLQFVREQLGEVRADYIVDGYQRLVSGSVDTDEFWIMCGIDRPGTEVSEEFLQRRRLRAGAANFLAEMQHRRIPVAALSNDSAEWSEHVRERDRLSAVWPWLVSADIGAAKPDLGMFEILRRESGISHGHCLLVDTDIDTLDAAAALGMKTVLYDTGQADLPEVLNHPVISDFKHLFGTKA